jgi:hypothetical protein
LAHEMWAPMAPRIDLSTGVSNATSKRTRRTSLSGMPYECSRPVRRGAGTEPARPACTNAVVPRLAPHYDRYALRHASDPCI